MAYNMYLGVNNVARKVNKVYVGIETQIQVSDNKTYVADITANNSLSDYFTAQNGTYTFIQNGSTYTSNNKAVKSGVATLTLTAIYESRLTFTASVSSEPSYDKFTVTVNGTLNGNTLTGVTSAYYDITLKKGDVVEIKYAKDSSLDKNDDQVILSGITVYYQKETDIRYETAYVARKVKKIYKEENGSAKLVWVSAKAVKKYKDDVMPYSKRYHAGASAVGNGVDRHALFAGGKRSSTHQATVYYFSDVLSSGTATALSEARSNLAGGSVSDYALFGGGYTGSALPTTVDTYNSKLTKGTTSAGLSEGREYLVCASTPTHAIFGGGVIDVERDTVDAYNTQLVHSVPTPLSTPRRYLAAAAVGQYALFAGGFDGTNYVDTVDVYDANLTRTTGASLSIGKYHLSGCSNGKYALFAGGLTPSYSSTVDAYNESLTKFTAMDLSVKKGRMGAARLNDKALFAGGRNSQSTELGEVEYYDDSLTRQLAPELLEWRAETVGVSIGDIAYFFGGIGMLGETECGDIYWEEDD